MRSTAFLLAMGVLLAVPVLAQDNPYQAPPPPPPDSAYQNGNNGYPGYPNYRYPDVVPAGTEIRVRTDHRIEVRDQSDGRIYRGTVTEDVLGPDGNLLIPHGALAELVVVNRGPRNLSLDLESLTIRDHRYMVDASTYNRARNESVGENRHTGEFVGGGALFGTIIGAIAGGGKGAAIGALAGAGAGAGAEVLTRGDYINIPAESVISFRLDDPLHLGRGRWAQDRGYDRNGYHYHSDYYNPNPPNQNPNSNPNNPYTNSNPNNNYNNPDNPYTNNNPNNPHQ